MHVIVTGGSSGIGLAVAKTYAAKGAHVSLISRDPARLEQAACDVRSLSADKAVFAVASDVTDEEQLTAAVNACQEMHGTCDVLIACAGIVEPATFDTLSPSLFNQQIATNLTGTANAVRAVYSGMKARRSGTVMIVSSGAALIGIHGYVAYCASKSALNGFVEALQAETVGTGVRISICYPPDTLTPQYQREMSVRPWQAEVLMGKVKPWTAEAVADRMVNAIASGSTRVYFTPLLMGLAYFGPFVKPILSLWYRWKLGKSNLEMGIAGGPDHSKSRTPGADPSKG